ncbi:MAG TPA: hypothetical protein VKF38_07160 [Anaerolineaceae bacterium]|nr:hypothetical protein [Anaerolineaceae bacterium]
MPESVYLLVLGQGFKEAWYRLSKAEQDALWSKAMDAEKQAGARLVIACQARWADEALSDWTVLEYPNLEAYQQKVAQLEKLNWWRYVSAKTVLGTKLSEMS